MRTSREYEPKITKTLRAFAARNADKVQEVYADPDGVWMHLKPGFIFTVTECGTPAR